MHRREYLATVAAAAGPMLLGARTRTALERDEDLRSFASPAKARVSPPEKLAYIVALYAGTEIRKPDYLATVDVDPGSATYSQVVHRLKMPNVGDELHHFGWNACRELPWPSGAALLDHPRPGLRPDPRRRYGRPSPA